MEFEYVFRADRRAKTIVSSIVCIWWNGFDSIVYHIQGVAQWTTIELGRNQTNEQFITKQKPSTDDYI